MGELLDQLLPDLVRRVVLRPRVLMPPEIGEYNYFCRNMLAVAYLHGRRPHLLMQRGTYRAIVIEAYDPELNLVWRWNSHQEKEKYDSQGAHTIRVADVDGDNCDVPSELVIRAKHRALDDRITLRELIERAIKSYLSAHS